MVKPVTFQGQFNFNANLYALEVKSRFIDQSKADGYYTGYGSELNAQIVGGNAIQIGTGAFVVQGRMCEITEAEIVRPQIFDGFKGYIIARIETYHPADEDNCSIIAKIQTSFDALNEELEQSDVYARTADNINTAYELPIYSFEISGTRIVNLTKLIKPVRDYATVKTIVDDALAKAADAVQKATQAVSTANAANTKSDNAVSTANAANATATSAQTAAGQAVSTATAADEKSDRAVSAAQGANRKANNAVELSEQSAAFAARAVNAANQAASDASDAVSTSQDAQEAAGNAVATANQAASDASTALGVANALDGKINTANATATSAQTAAGNAVATANATATQVNEALSAQDEEIADLAEQIAEGQGTRVTIGGVVQNTFPADEYIPAEADAAKTTPFAFYSQESERAAGYIRGGEIDKEIKALKARILALENN